MALYSTLNQYMHFNVQKTITVKTSTVKMPSRVAFSNCTVTAKTHTHEQARNQLGTPGGGGEALPDYGPAHEAHKTCCRSPPFASLADKRQCPARAAALKILLLKVLFL